jgi:WD40 repeat protein
MPISMECPSCMNSFSLPDELAGRKTKCPECQFSLFVPQGDAPIDATASRSSSPSASVPTPNKVTATPTRNPTGEVANRTPAPSKKVRAVPKKSAATTTTPPPASDNPFDFNGKESGGSHRRKSRGKGGIILLCVLVVFLLGGLLVVAGGGAVVWYLLRPAQTAVIADAPVQEEVRYAEAPTKVEDQDPPKKSIPKEEPPKKDPPKNTGGKPVRDPILDAPMPMENPDPKPNPNPTKPNPEPKLPDAKKGQLILAPIPPQTVKAGEKVLINVSVVRVDCKGTVTIIASTRNHGITMGGINPILPEDIDQTKMELSVAATVAPGLYKIPVNAVLNAAEPRLSGAVFELTVEKAAAPVADNPPPPEQGKPTLQIINARVHLEGHIYTSHAAAVESVALSADGKWGLSGSADGSVNLWELTKGQVATIFTAPGGTTFTAVALSPDGKLAAFGDAKGTVRLQNLEKKETIILRDAAKLGAAVQAKGLRVNALMFSPKGDLLAVADPQGISCFTAATGKLATSAPIADSPCLRFTPDGAHVLGISGKKIVNVGIPFMGQPLFLGNQTEYAASVFDAHFGKHELIAVVPQEKQGDLQRISLATGKMQQLTTFATLNEVPLRIAVADKAGFAITSDRDGVIRGIELDTGKELFKIAGHKGEVHGLAVSADGRRMLSGGADNTFRVVDLTNPKGDDPKR